MNAAGRPTWPLNRPVFVGRPGRGPSTLRGGWRLAALLELPEVELARVVDVVHLAGSGGAFPSLDARRAADALRDDLAGRRVVALGVGVARAFGLEVRALGIWTGSLAPGAHPTRVLAIPDPSGAFWPVAERRSALARLVRRFGRIPRASAARVDALARTTAAAKTRRLELELTAMDRMELELMRDDQRARALLLVADGKGCAGAARAVGMCRSSVSAWVRAYSEGGIEALHPRRGRPRKPAA